MWAHVESMNERIHFLEQLLAPFASDQIARIMAELVKAVQNLEELQATIPSVLPVTRQVIDDLGIAYDLLQRLEDKLYCLQTPNTRRTHAGSSRAQAANRQEENLTEDTRRGPRVNSGVNGEQPERRRHDAGDGRSHMSGALPSPHSSASPGGSSSSQMDTSPKPREDAAEHKQEVFFQMNAPRPRAQVMANLLAEEFSGLEVSMRDPDRVRQGSTSGWLCAQEIMCGIEDFRSIRPKLAFIKIYEVKALKLWLMDRKYVQRSEGISRTEKLLQLIFALQDGARFEVLAVLFSRSPRQIERCCVEVFSGLLEMHSETMLPSASRRPLYDHLWKVIDRYATVSLTNRARHYYPWDTEDLYKVLVTLNFYIGRWRKQGRSALGGPFLDWGNYVQSSNMSN